MCACRRWGGLVVRLQTAPRPAKRGHVSLRGEPSGSFASAVAAAATVARRTPLSGRAPRGWALAGAACLGVAALSLLVSHEPTYDPAAWLIWGREILHGDLSTTAGPSWKPLPILVTAPAALLGDGAQQDVWLIVARGGALAALVLCYRLAWRLEGPVAGVIAAVALLVSSGYATRTFRGDSEGILVALAFGAIETHLVGRRRLAFGLLVATALLRPEMWLFAGLYGLWLPRVRAAPGRRGGGRAGARGAARGRSRSPLRRASWSSRRGSCRRRSARASCCGRRRGRSSRWPGRRRRRRCRSSRRSRTRRRCCRGRSTPRASSTW